MTTREVGHTKTQGWEIGVRRTFPIAPDEAWQILMTQPGLGCWLGEGVEPYFKQGDTYKTSAGTTGEIRSFSRGSLIRLTWKPKKWDFTSTLQLRVLPAKTGATISFHHEKLENGDQREQMRDHWSKALDQIGKLIG